MKAKTYSMLSVITAAAFFSTGVLADDASKLDPKKPMAKAVEAKMIKGKGDVKVNAAAATNSTAPEVKTRSGSHACDIHIDNRTSLFINRVYIDGNNWGAVGRYGDSLVTNIGEGATTLYAEVEFTDGSTAHYGPAVFNCEAWSTFTWTLR